MKTAVILAAGDGTKIWPYAEVRPKVMIPIANKPIIAYQIEWLAELGFERILIIGGNMCEQIEHYVMRKLAKSLPTSLQVKIIRENRSTNLHGTAISLLAAEPYIETSSFLVLYGDTLFDKKDIARLLGQAEAHQTDQRAFALISPLRDEPSQDWICCRLGKHSDKLDIKAADSTSGDIAGSIDQIMGHPRDGSTHRFCAFVFTKPFFHYCATNSGQFTNIQVGMMPPREGHLEMSMTDWLNDNNDIIAVEAQGNFIDVDKPWHIMLANDWMVRLRCNALTSHELDAGASIDDAATINGFVRLGKNSRIGKNVVVEGNIIVGDNTTIDNGALLQGQHIIGDHTFIGNYCYLADRSTVGNHCVINHCAELDGIIMDTVYLYHYMEFYGVIGTGTDLGAATVCGTLRFDDGLTTHRVKGRKEFPRIYGDAIYLGDYVRTGVNAILMPGVKVGVHSIIGPGVLLQEDIPNGKIVSVKQDLTIKEWGPHRYGW